MAAFLAAFVFADQPSVPADHEPALPSFPLPSFRLASRSTLGPADASRRVAVGRATDGGERGRVLLICHAYATDGHTGSFRWRSLVRLLGARGWRFDVMALDPETGAGPAADAPASLGQRASHRPETDDEAHVHVVPGGSPVGRWRQRRLQAWLARERSLAAGSTPGEHPPVAPENVPVVAHGEPLGWREHLRMLPTTLLDLLERRLWTRRARRLAHTLAVETRYDLVLATSPSPAAHDVGVDVARRHGIPLVLEYRDPRHFGRGADVVRLDALDRWTSRRAELDALRTATAVVDIAAGAARASAKALEPVLADIPRVVIPSGYERTTVEPVDTACFRIVYTGWLWPFMPLPTLLAAAGRFCAERDALTGHAATDVSVELVGVERCFNGVPVDAIARAVGLGRRFEARPRLPRDVAAHVQERAAVLVAFDSVCAGGKCIPSKLYHYAQCHGALLPIGRPDGSMAGEADRIGVRTWAADDVDGIVGFLHGAHARWARGEMTASADPEGALEFTHRADEMEALFERVRARTLRTSPTSDTAR